MARLFKQGEAKELGLPGRRAMEIVSGERGARGVTLRLVEIPMAKPTLHDLEDILDNEEDVPIEILPNGEIRAVNKGSAELGGRKPLTMREDLGGEYGGEGGLSTHP